MTTLIPKNKTRLLLVEGKEDKEFFIRLGSHMKFTEATPIHILQYDGKDKLAGLLYQVMQVAEFDHLLHVGIVRDADFNTNALQSAKDAIVKANRQSVRNLPVPVSEMTVSEGNPKVSILILPSTGREGMLEDVVMDALDSDPVTTCVDQFFDCLRENDLAVLRHKLSKARLRSFVTGKNACDDVESGDSDKVYLSDVFHMSWWKPDFWEHPTFNDAKDFLRQLLAD